MAVSFAITSHVKLTVNTERTTAAKVVSINNKTSYFVSVL